MALTVWQHFVEACGLHSDRPAVSSGDQVLTYLDLLNAVNDLAETLSGNFVIDDADGAQPVKIAIYAENSIDYILTYYAALKLGLLPFLIDRAFGKNELESISASCGIELFAMSGDQKAFALSVKSAASVPNYSLSILKIEPVQTAPQPCSDTVTCRFTSGTTGSPKCLEFSQKAVVNAAQNWVKGSGLCSEDNILCVATFANGLAFNTSLLATFLAGAHLHLFSGPLSSGRIVSVLQKRGITRLVGFPFLYKLLTEGKKSISTVRHAVSAGAQLGEDIKNNFFRQNGFSISDYFGIAEVGPCTWNSGMPESPGLGKALPGVELAVDGSSAHPAEILVKTASMATRYLNYPGLLESKINAEGFYQTGDIGYLSDNVLFVTGRLGRGIEISGRKIDPVEIENFVRSMPGVQDAHAYAGKDMNEETVIEVSVSSTNSIDPSDIRHFCRQALPSFKVPSLIFVFNELPRSSSGKIRQDELMRMTASAKP